MKIACLITVCVAISSMLRTAETVQLQRRSSSKDHPMIPKARYHIVKNEGRTTTFDPAMTFSSRKTQTVSSNANKKSGKPYKNQSPASHWQISSNSQHDRRRRQLKHYDVVVRRLGRSYEMNDNHIETIQVPETFEKGTIHIEPLYRVMKNKNILDNLIDLFQKTIDPGPKSHLGPLVGPLHVPGVGEKVYIRLLEPVKSDHLVIRLITQLPYSEIESSFNQNIFPVNAITKQVEVPTIEHQSVLSTDAISSSSSSLNNAITIPPSPNALVTDLSSDSSKETSRIFKTFNMKSKYTDHRRIPAAQLFGQSRKRFPENAAPYKTVRYYNTNRPSINSMKKEEVYASSQFKESQVRDQPGSFKDSSFYPHYQNHQQATLTSLPNDSSAKGTSNNGDIQAETSLNPLYMSNSDNSPLRQVIRTGRVVPMTGFVPKSYPTVNEALKVVDAPVLSSSRVQNYSVSVGYPKPQIRYLNLDGSVATSGYPAKNEKRDNEESIQSARGNSNEKSVNSNRYWASKKRNLNEEEKDKLIVERDEFKTTERAIAKSDDLETFLRIASKPRNVTVVKNTTNSMAKVSRNTTRNSERMAECLECKYSEKGRSSTFNEYEYIEDPIFDDYYEDEMELRNSTKIIAPTTTQPTLRATTRASLITTSLKSVSSSTPKSVSQSTNLRKRLVMIKKTPIES